MPYKLTSKTQSQTITSFCFALITFDTVGNISKLKLPQNVKRRYLNDSSLQSYQLTVRRKIIRRRKPMKTYSKAKTNDLKLNNPKKSDFLMREWF